MMSVSGDGNLETHFASDALICFGSRSLGTQTAIDTATVTTSNQFR